MQRAGQFNFNRQVAGDHFEVTIFEFHTALVDVDGNEILDADGNPQEGDPIDMTGATARIQFRRNDPNGKLVKTLTTANNSLVWLNAANGVLQLNTFVIDWGEGEYFWNLEITSGSGIVLTYVIGKCQIVKDATKQ